MLEPDMYHIAYEAIIKNRSREDGKMIYENRQTQVVTTNDIAPHAVKEFSREEIQKIISELKDHTFQFLPSRRIIIPKSNGQNISLGVPGFRDEVVLKIMAQILETIYDHGPNPVFSDASHGFRKGHNTHTALKYLST